MYAGIERDENGRQCLVAKTLDPAQNARLVLVESGQDMVHSNLTYLVQRLTNIGMAVVSSEAQLQAA